MRIPPSLVVMSMVTAVPFGLAIRDTIAGTTRTDELDLTGEKARAREDAVQAIANAKSQKEQMEAAIEARERERDAKLDSLYGKTPASLGTLFDGVTLGAPIDAFQTEEARERIEDLMGDRLVDVSYRGVTHLYEVHVDVPFSACSSFHDRLLMRWGTRDQDVWLDPATHIRANLSVDQCALDFSQYIEVDEWVARLPVDALGKAGTFVESTMPGVGRGRGYTSIASDRDDSDRVKGITVVAETDVATQLAIRNAISAKLGIEPSAGPGSNVMTWNSKPRVRLDVSGASRFSVQIGTPSWQ